MEETSIQAATTEQSTVDRERRVSEREEIDIPLVAADIIQYWFGSAYWKRRGLVSQPASYWDDLWVTRWFAKEQLGEEVDRYIRETWGQEIEKVLHGHEHEGHSNNDNDDDGDSRKKTTTDDYIETWMRCPTGAVALIVLLDQFSRNAFRGTPKAWVSLS